MGTKKLTVQGLRSKNTIVLHPSEGQPINISRDTNEILFLEVEDLLQKDDMEALVEKFLDIKGKVERYSLNLFTVDEEKGEMFLKGTKEPMPELMVDKLFELEENGEDFMPLIRFWKKLQDNESKESREQLYGFMVHNGIGLTEGGDIVTEKGVSVKNGKLVDSRTRTIDNSIGQSPEIPRSGVDPDPNKTCSRGLHVGAPDYVRNYYSQDVIIRCSVNPADVVAVPTDYKNTKMRVCKYTVLGYAEDKTVHKPIFRLSDFITTPSGDVAEKIKKSIPTPAPTVEKEEKEVAEVEVAQPVVVEAKPEPKAEAGAEYKEIAEDLLKGLTGKQILDTVEAETGIRMPYSEKSKSTLLKRGTEILANHLETMD